MAWDMVKRLSEIGFTLYLKSILFYDGVSAWCRRKTQSEAGLKGLPLDETHEYGNGADKPL